MSTRTRTFCTHGDGMGGAYGCCDACVEKLLDERDQLREVLRDVSEERGLNPSLVKLEKTLAEARKELKNAGFAEAYGQPLGDRASTNMFVKTREHLDNALRLLRGLIRDPPEERISAKLFDAPCRVCGAAKDTACRAEVHGAAWCAHLVCGRLMRGAVCDHCGKQPPMAEVMLVPPIPRRTNAYAGGCAHCGAYLGDLCAPGCPAA